MTETSRFAALSAVIQRIEQSGLPAEMAPVLVEAREELEKLEQDYLRLEKQSEETDKAKAKFVSVVTHELRIPMTSIKGYTDLLRSGAAGAVNEQQAGFLTVVRNNVDRMSALVSDLSDLSHIESGRMNVTLSSFSLSTLIADLSVLFKPRFDEKKQAFTVNVPTVLPNVFADRARLNQVLAAFLNNALKYTPEGGSISVSVDTNGDQVRVEVADNGAGISEGDQKQVFTQFFRSEDPAVRDQPGWGLNLSVAHKLVQMMGGEIGFHSRYREGSTFWISIPVAKQP